MAYPKPIHTYTHKWKIHRAQPTCEGGARAMAGWAARGRWNEQTAGKWEAGRGAWSSPARTALPSSTACHLTHIRSFAGRSARPVCATGRGIWITAHRDGRESLLHMLWGGRGTQEMKYCTVFPVLRLLFAIPADQWSPAVRSTDSVQTFLQEAQKNRAFY